MLAGCRGVPVGAAMGPLILQASRSHTARWPGARPLGPGAPQRPALIAHDMEAARIQHNGLQGASLSSAAVAAACSPPPACRPTCAAPGRRQLPGAQPMQHQLSSAATGAPRAAAWHPATLRSRQRGEHCRTPCLATASHLSTAATCGVGASAVHTWVAV